MGVIIPESDMEFGEYQEKQVFRIEESEQYTKKLRQQGVRCCEFILLRSNKLLFIEAKKSYPDPINGIIKDKNQYYTDIKEIVEKMQHSLDLYANILLNRYVQDGVSEEVKNIENLEMRLVLVIKNADKSWIIPLQEKFRKELNAEMRIWKIQGINKYVMVFLVFFFFTLISFSQSLRFSDDIISFFTRFCKLIISHFPF